MNLSTFSYTYTVKMFYLQKISSFSKLLAFSRHKPALSWHFVAIPFVSFYLIDLLHSAALQTEWIAAFNTTLSQKNH